MPLRTDPRGFVVRALSQLLRGTLPAVAALFGAGAAGMLTIGIAIAIGSLFSFGFAWLQWRRKTYLTGAEDIRVEQGLLEHKVRSVPYERIQDVSIEQKFLARLFGLAEVKFETGAGGKEEIALAYLTLDEAERLRALVRERKEGGVAVAPSPAASDAGEAPSTLEEAAPLFAMDNRRVLTFGLFEFSLVIFAVLLGAAQQFEFLLPFELWDEDSWRWLVRDGGAQVDGLAPTGRVAQVASVLGGIALVVVLGIVTGVARTFAREFGFVLDETPRGFRRRRGLFNKTDVLMPVHRVQAALLHTGWIRRRFGWHGLDFVSLAQDGAKTPNHAVAPFARLDEIWPVLRAAGMEPPPDDLDWHRPSRAPWLFAAIVHALVFSCLALLLSRAGEQPWWLVVGAVAVIATLVGNLLGWRRHCHALALGQVFARKGRLAPQLALAPLVKLQSVEIAQSPLGRWQGYATVRFGLAGGRLELPGVPLAEAEAIRREALERIVAVDFSRLPR